MNRRFFIGVMVPAAGLISAAAAAPEAEWTPDKKMRGNLAPLTTAGPYQIQPPKGFAPQTQPGPAGATGHAWVSAPRKDGTRSYLMMVLLTPPAGEEKKYTLAEISAKMLAGVERRHKDWKQSAPESGRINGLPAIRTYWRGTHAEAGRRMRGFSYVVQDGNRFVQVSSQDVEPDANTALALTEAAALTLRKP